MPNDFTRNLEGVRPSVWQEWELGILEECHSVSHLVDLAHLQCLYVVSSQVHSQRASMDLTHSLKDSRSSFRVPTLQVRLELNTLVEDLVKVGFGGQRTYRTICEDARGQVPQIAGGVFVKEGREISRISVVGIAILSRCLEIHEF